MIEQPTTPSVTEDVANPDTASIIRWYTRVAIGEAVSWAALLVAMVFKYALVKNAVGVRIVGPIHGTMFLAYLACTIAVARRQRWSLPLSIVGLLSAIPPFCTVLFESWVTRAGHLADPPPEHAR